MRAVLDTNVLISGLMVATSAPSLLIAAWRSGRFELITSNALIYELEDVLSRPRIGRLLNSPPLTAEALLDELRANARIVTAFKPLAVVERDPDDNRVVEAAVAGNVDYIVSGDRHLLDFGSYEGIRVVTPAQFLAILPAG